MRLRFTFVLSASLMFCAASIKAGEPVFIRQFEQRVFDVYQQLNPRPYEAVPVRIVDLDDESLKNIGQWPWPRTQIARLLHNLHDAGAAVILFDIVFAEPDRTSPKEMLKIWDNNKELGHILSTLPDPDSVLADTIASSNTVTGFVLTHGKDTAMPAKKAGIVVAGENALSFLPTFTGAVTSLPELEAHAAGNGGLNSDPDGDGILRRVPLIFRAGENMYPSLSAEALRVAQGASSYIVKTVGANGEGGAGHGVTAVRTGKITVPTDPEGGLWVYFTKYVPERYIPAWKVLNGDFNHDAIAGHIVLIGTSAAGLKDIRTTPLDPAAAGVEVHAQAIEQALLGISLSRPDWMRGAEICMMVVGAGLMLLAAQMLPQMLSALMMVGLMALMIGVSWHAFTMYRLLVEPVTSIIAILLLYFSESLGRYVRTEEERKRVRHAFSHYMAPAMVEDLARHPEKLKLGGESKPLSVMFCDIRGFTTISEQMNPVELTSLINHFLTPMTDVIQGNQGTIDKYIGDCIMAFWNAPVDDPDHAAHAAKSALEMFEALKPLNQQREEQARISGHIYLPLRIGIGINTGECCVGNMGANQRFNYSALGDEVNLASRLEGLSKMYGVDIVVGDSTAACLPHMALLELDLIRVKGKKIAKRIFTLLGDEKIATNDTFKRLVEVHENLLSAYRSQVWGQALQLVEQCRAIAHSLWPDALDALYDEYQDRCHYYSQNPPAPDWDAAWDATSK